MKHIFLWTFIGTLAFLFLLPAVAMADGDRITGTWLTEGGTGKIQIYKCGKKYCGKTVWIKPSKENPHPEKKKDTLNPNPKKRDRLLINATILWGLVYNAEDSVWENGSIYDSRKGKIYQCKVRMEKNGTTLLFRGFVGFALLGQTTRWTRVN